MSKFKITFEGAKCKLTGNVKTSIQKVNDKMTLKDGDISVCGNYNPNTGKCGDTENYCDGCYGHTFKYSNL